MSKMIPLAAILNLDAKRPRRPSHPIKEVPNNCLPFVERKNSAKVNYKHFPYLMYTESTSRNYAKRKPPKVKTKPRKKKSPTGPSPKLVLHPSRNLKERYRTIEDALLVTNPPLMGVEAISFMSKNTSLENEDPTHTRRPGSQQLRRLNSRKNKPLSRSASSSSNAPSHSTLSMPLTRSITQCRSEGRLNKQLCVRWFGSMSIEKENPILQKRYKYQ